MRSNIDFLSFFRFRDTLQLILFASLTLIVVLLFAFITLPSSQISTLGVILVAVMSVIIGILSFYLTFQKHPSLLLISLIGFTRSGKTVYLTMLFNEFMPKKIDGVLFSTYGSETAEEVGKNLNLLYAKKWLLPTKVSSVFPFRAIASLESGLTRKKFKIEIDDFAGEYSEEIKDESWIHKSKYFDNVMKSDVIFFTIDGECILNSIKNQDTSQTHSLENSYITALKLIMEGKGVPLERKMKTPVALIVTKCDLFYSYFEKFDNMATSGKSVTTWDSGHKHVIQQSIQRLLDYCEGNLSNYQIFYTTSVGKLDDDNTPSSSLKPENITKPIIWALHNVD
jgi:hypothetical protein